MSSNFKPTETEWKILNEVRRRLGDNLSDYLLSGLGEIDVKHCRAFTARSTSRHSENVIYRFEIISESALGLPRGRDQLVLAAFLLDVMKYPLTNSTLCFSDSEVIEKLHWPDTAESKLMIKRALERYLLTAFYLIDPTIGEDERIFDRYARFRRLLVAYETDYFIYPLAKKRVPGEMRLIFLPDLKECVFSDGKHFLGVEFLKLRGMKEVSCEELRDTEM